ncbi:MAG: rhodanese-like domain-containing protein [Chloroflexota bacterium]
MLERPELSEVPRTNVEDAKASFDRGEAVFVDLRSREAYERSHIPGAVSIPIQELYIRYGELPRDRKIIFY